MRCLRQPERVVAVHKHSKHTRSANHRDGAGMHFCEIARRFEHGPGRIPERGFGVGWVGRDRAYASGQDNPPSPRRVRLVLVRISAMHDQIGAIEGGCEEFLVALEFQFIRHRAIGVCQHAVRGYDDIAIDAQIRHRARTIYSEIVCTTLETGRELTVGSLASLTIWSSYCASVCTGSLALIATTL